MKQTQQYVVEKYQGTREIRTIELDEDGKAYRGKDGLIVYKTEKVEGGFIVTLPRGDSLYVKDIATLKSLGFDRVPAMVDEDGEVIPEEYAKPIRGRNKPKNEGE